MPGLQIILTIAIFPLTVLSGLYVYRYLNNKLLNASTRAGIIGFGLLLFLALGGILSAGLWLMAWLYDYMGT
ncbi:hypothetical protein [Niabella soli]|uniref:Uncharacterized protein n=1 Tax=Niabella soli DSM 19437 TaxID=929713 RepID=W0F739_9BACT|nr:hypothetical protein [Niabella soli]AHF17156.1 hypothetical protein NIASO_02680 [Niabella soli DSM 19437]